MSILFSTVEWNTALCDITKSVVSHIPQQCHLVDLVFGWFVFLSEAVNRRLKSLLLKTVDLFFDDLTPELKWMEKGEFRCGSFKSATPHHPVFTFAKHLGSRGKQTAHYQHLLLLPLQRTSSVAGRTEPKQRWIKSVKKNKVFLGARWEEQFIHLKMCLVLSVQLKQTAFFTVFSTLLPFAGWGWGPGGGGRWWAGGWGGPGGREAWVGVI